MESSIAADVLDPILGSSRSVTSRTTVCTTHEVEAAQEAFPRARSETDTYIFSKLRLDDVNLKRGVSQRTLNCSASLGPDAP